MEKFIYQLYSALDKRDRSKTYLLIRHPVDSTAQQCALLVFGASVEAVKHKTRANAEYFKWESHAALRHFEYAPNGLLDEWAIGGKL